jgi:undecaprenyl-diphosphatase
MKFDQARYENWQTILTGRRILRWFVIVFGLYTVLYFMLVGVWLLYQREYRVVIMSFVAFVIARFIITGVISFLYKKPRPYQLYKFKPVMFSRLLSWESKTPASFPSGHMAGMMAISVSLFLFNPIVGTVAFIITLLTGIARILMGYHYPSDILIGIAIGFLSGYGIEYLARYF